MARLRYLRLTRLAASLLWVALASSSLFAGKEATVDELKSRVANANVTDRPPLCLRIAERQVNAADKSFSVGEIDRAQAALNDVLAFSELARDYAIRSHKHEKQAEIAIRKMSRKLVDMKRIISRDDQEQVQKTIDRMERIRDDLLAAMFPKEGKK